MGYDIYENMRRKLFLDFDLKNVFANFSYLPTNLPTNKNIFIAIISGQRQRTIKMEIFKPKSNSTRRNEQIEK